MAFTVADQGDDLVALLPDLAAERDTDRERQAVPQGTGRRLGTGHLGAVRMATGDAAKAEVVGHVRVGRETTVAVGTA